MESNGGMATRKLLIVGNGFDRAHSLPTGYIDFKKYMSELIREYQGEAKSETLLELKEIPGPGMPKIHTRNGIVDDYESERKLVYWLIDEVAKKKRDLKWGEFENYLGQLNTKKTLKIWEEDEFNEQFLREAISDISGFFFEWINTIDLSAVQKKNPYLSIIDGENDIAISFNYTETLEKVYEMKASNICYVHGQREMNPVLQMKKKMLSFGKENSNLVVGFGKKYVRNKKMAKKKLLLMSLFKDTEKIIYAHKDFFDKIAYLDIKEIYSFGFSFSDVDIPYINKICNELNRKSGTKKMTWFITPYGRNSFKKLCEELHMRKSIWKAGFRGNVRKI